MERSDIINSEKDKMKKRNLSIRIKSILAGCLLVCGGHLFSAEAQAPSWLQIKPEAVTGSMMPKYKYIINNYGFAVKVFQNGTLLRTFIVPKDLSAVYRFGSDGSDVMIYNIDGSKG